MAVGPGWAQPAWGAHRLGQAFLVKKQTKRSPVSCSPKTPLVHHVDFF